MAKKTTGPPIERKIMSPKERMTLLDKQRKANEPMNQALRSAKGEQVEFGDMNQFIRDQAHGGTSPDPALAAAMAGESDANLNELEAKYRKARLENRCNVAAQRAITKVLRAIAREQRKRRRKQ